MLSFFFLFIIRPPPSSTLFPYTTLFRSGLLHSQIHKQLSDTLTFHRAAPIRMDSQLVWIYSLLQSGTENRSKPTDRKSTRLNSSHANISYAVFCLKKKKKKKHR